GLCTLCKPDFSTHTNDPIRTSICLGHISLNHALRCSIEEADLVTLRFGEPDISFVIDGETSRCRTLRDASRDILEGRSTQLTNCISCWFSEPDVPAFVHCKERWSRVSRRH